MSLKTCPDLTEAIPLEPSLGLYLKPISRLKINVQLPRPSGPGQSISSWHIMEKLKETVRPDTFLYLKALKIAPNVIKLEGELETKASCDRALARLRAASALRVTGFAEKLPMKAAHAAVVGPTRHDWEAFFRDAKGVNEMRPGERPDTVHLEEVPARWFAESSRRPSEKVLQRAFGTFGKIRRLEIRRNDSISSPENAFGKKSSLQSDVTFEAYIQYEEYVEFSIAMESLRGKKLLYKEPEGKVYAADIKVDFDRANYLSDRCIKLREAEAKKLHHVVSSPEKTKSIKEDAKGDKNFQPSEPSEQSVGRETEREEEKGNKKTAYCEQQEKSEAKLLLKELLRRAERHKKKMDADTEGKSRAGLQESKELKKSTKTPKVEESEMCSDTHSVAKEKNRPTSKGVPESRETRSEKRPRKEGNYESDSERPDKKPRREERTKKRTQLFYEAKKNEKHKEEVEEDIKKQRSEGKDKTSVLELKDKDIKKQHSDGKNKTSVSEFKGNKDSLHYKSKQFINNAEGKKNEVEGEEAEEKKREMLILQERILKEKLLKNLKAREEEKLRNREKLRRELAGRRVLKSVLVNHSIHKKS